MSDQHEALRLATMLHTKHNGEGLLAYCEAELRCQHSRIEELENELMEQCRINGMGAERELAKIARIEADEALMRQVCGVLEHATSFTSRKARDQYEAAITALRKRLESSK